MFYKIESINIYSNLWSTVDFTHVCTHIFDCLNRMNVCVFDIISPALAALLRLDYIRVFSSQAIFTAELVIW